MKTGITPFANDCFAFAAMAQKLIPLQNQYDIEFHDLEKLNQQALSNGADLLKVSFNILSGISGEYQLLPVGSCLGYDNGPKIIAGSSFKLSDLNQKTIGIPGKNTTAYMLLRIFAPGAKLEVECPYHELIPKVKSGDLDCALVIHESRFQLAEFGVEEIGDLFDLWSRETNSPLPLGGIVARRSLGPETLRSVTRDLQNSLSYADSHKDQALQFALSHSFKKDLSFVEKSIDLYVNDETRHVSNTGIRSIQSLISLGSQAGLIPSAHQDWLFDSH